MPTAERKVWAKQLQAKHDISVVMSCAVVGVSRTAFYHEPKGLDDSIVMDALERLVDRHPRWGFPKCFKRLRALGHRWNHKRVYRVYTEMRLNMRCKSKKRLPPRNPEPLAAPTVPGRTWSMDFMNDTLQNNVRFRTFNVIDDFNREVLGIDIGTGLPSARVTRYLDRLAACQGYPETVRVDNGPEFTSSGFTDWAARHHVKIDYIEPGCPYQNAYIERFNRTYREEVLDLYLFANLREVIEHTEHWIERYNTERPHDSLKGMTPIEFKLAA